MAKPEVVVRRLFWYTTFGNGIKLKGGRMKGKDEKEKVYVCKVCGKEQKSKERAECCGKDMLEKKEVWRD